MIVPQVTPKEKVKEPYNCILIIYNCHITAKYFIVEKRDHTEIHI